MREAGFVPRRRRRRAAGGRAEAAVRRLTGRFRGQPRRFFFAVSLRAYASASRS
jgi:hypothetical protein